MTRLRTGKRRQGKTAPGERVYRTEASRSGWQVRGPGRRCGDARGSGRTRTENLRVDPACRDAPARKTLVGIFAAFRNRVDLPGDPPDLDSSWGGSNSARIRPRSRHRNGCCPVLERTEGEGRSAPPVRSSVQRMHPVRHSQGAGAARSRSQLPQGYSVDVPHYPNIQNVVLTLHVTALLVCGVAF